MPRKSKTPKSRKIRISALTMSQEIQYRYSLDAVKLLRDGRAKSLTHASLESSTTAKTVRRYASSAMSFRGSKYHFKPSDRLRREIAFYDSKGRTPLVTHSSRQANQIAAYHNAINAYLVFGDDCALRAFDGQSITVHGKSYPFTNRHVLSRLARAGELNFSKIYASDMAKCSEARRWATSPLRTSRGIEEYARRASDERRMQRHPPKAAISYAHGPRDPDVIALSDRLRSDGVDCEIDAYDDAPMHGWGRWMIDMMTTRTVLVIASKIYYQRYKVEDEPGVGLGATFESGLLVQRALEAQGANINIIPVLLRSSDEQYVPEFLRDVTRYDLSKPDGYERLLRRLTNQPAHPRPSVGPVRELPPRATPQPQSPRLALIQPREGGTFVFRIGDVERTSSLKIIFIPRDHAELARLQGLREEHEPMAIAYASTALFGRVKEHREFMGDDGDRVEIVFEERPISDGYAMEFSFNGITSDEIAEMRARRILLDERVARKPGSLTVDVLNDSTLEGFVKASSSSSGRLVVTNSPIPTLASDVGRQSEHFRTIARLACIMQLILSGTVERVSRLDLTTVDDGVAIEFEGARRRVYSNAPVHVIRVTGTCPL